MSHQDRSADGQKGTSVRALQFTPPKAKDGSLITSSVRKKKRDTAPPLQSPAAKRLNLNPEPASSPTGEERSSPQLRRRQPDAEQPVQHEAPEGLPDAEHPEDSALAEQPVTGERDAAEEARTANPPRPPPELPPGIPAPPIPKGTVPQPGPEHGHLPAGAKPKGVLQTIFSPMFHLFQPGEAQTQEEAAEKAKTEGRPVPVQQKPGQGRRGSSPKKAGAKRRSKTPQQQDKGAPADGDAALRLLEPANAAQPDELGQQGAAEGAAQAAEAAAQPGSSAGEGKKGAASKPAVSEGISSTDGESETCIGGQPASTVSSSRGSEPEEESEAGSESEMGEEVYVADAAHDLDEDSLEFDPYAFIKSLPPLDQCAPAWRRSLLPKQTRQCKRKTLVLDLDETLVHSTLDGSDSADFSFQVSFNNRTHGVNVKQRPHLEEFLRRCADLFEVVIFTASQKLYAEQLLNILDPDRKLIRHRIFRDSCLLVEGNYLKDLSVLGRDLAHTVIVDNSPQAFGFQLANGVPIESWYDDEADTELMRLLPFLEGLVEVPDVRPVIINAFKLHQLVAKAPRYL